MRTLRTQNFETFTFRAFRLSKVFKVLKFQRFRILKLLTCQISKVQNCQASKILNYQVPTFPSCQVAKFLNPRWQILLFASSQIPNKINYRVNKFPRFWEICKNFHKLDKLTIWTFLDWDYYEIYKYPSCWILIQLARCIVVDPKSINLKVTPTHPRISSPIISKPRSLEA